MPYRPYNELLLAPVSIRAIPCWGAGTLFFAVIKACWICAALTMAVVEGLVTGTWRPLQALGAPRNEQVWSSLTGWSVADHHGPSGMDTPIRRA